MQGSWEYKTTNHLRTRKKRTEKSAVGIESLYGMSPRVDFDFPKDVAARNYSWL